MQNSYADVYHFNHGIFKPEGTFGHLFQIPQFTNEATAHQRWGSSPSPFIQKEDSGTEPQGSNPYSVLSPAHLAANL